MKKLALYSLVVCLSLTTGFGQTESDFEFLQARADAHERKISQLEQELKSLRALIHQKPSSPISATAKEAPKAQLVSGDDSATNSYVVKQGDVLSRIAHNHQTSVASILEANGLKSDCIHAGQKLSIPQASAHSTSKTDLKTRPNTVGKHEVQKNETFYSIARTHNVSVASLIAANPEVIPTRLQVGQTLVIDGSARAASRSLAGSGSARPQQSPQKKASPGNKATSHTPSASAPEPEIRTITVNKEITYGQFASSHGASTTQLNELNGLDLSKNTMLAKGSELYVPKF